MLACCIKWEEKSKPLSGRRRQWPWKRILFNFQVPAGVNQINIVLSDESVAAGTTLYWDFIEAEDSVLLTTSGGGPGGTLDVVREDFQDDTAGPWLSNTGNAPQSNGRPGQWVPSGHVANDNPTNPNLDFDWRPL